MNYPVTYREDSFVTINYTPTTFPEELTTGPPADHLQTGNIETAILLLVGSLGVAMNGFVVAVISRFRHIRRRLTILLMMNQSLVDLVASFILTTYYISRRVSGYLVVFPGAIGVLYCRYWLSAGPLWAALMTSTYNLLSITLERYLMVLHPIYYKTTFTRKKAIILIVCLWCVCPAYHLLSAGLTAEITDNICIIYSRWPSVTLSKIYGLTTVTIQFVFPILSMAYMYARMIIVLQTKPRRNAGNGNRIGNEAGTAQTLPNGDVIVCGGKTHLSSVQRNLIKTLVILVICFVCCWITNQGYWLVYNLGYGINVSETFINFSVLMVYVNCCVNPFIYIFKFEEFRVRMRVLFRKKRVTHRC